MMGWVFFTHSSVGEGELSSGRFFHFVEACTEFVIVN